MQAARYQFCLPHLTLSPKRPVAVIQQVVDRIGKGIDLHLTSHTMHRNDLADDDQVFGRGRRRSHNKCA
jgi:hypothetical protein